MRSSTNACADSVTSAAHASPCVAAISTAIAPPTLWPNNANRSSPSASRNSGKPRASSRMKSMDGGPVRAIERPSRPVVGDDLAPVALASAAGKSCQSSTHPKESCNSRDRRKRTIARSPAADEQAAIDGLDECVAGFGFIRLRLVFGKDKNQTESDACSSSSPGASAAGD
ncbi:MAG: hypothetical protein U1F20_04875 [Lysobacterales bacterium]